MANKNKRNKPHVEIGTIGHVGFSKTSALLSLLYVNTGKIARLHFSTNIPVAKIPKHKIIPIKIKNILYFLII